MPAPPPDFNPREPFAFLPAPEGPGRLFIHPRQWLAAERLDEVAPALEQARALAAGGMTLVGGLAFEAAAAFEPRLAPRFRPPGVPLLWFAAFDGAIPCPIEALPGADRPAATGTPGARLSAAGHAAAHGRIQALIAAGDIYQANLTFAADVALRGHPVALFRRLFEASPVPHAALVHTGRHWWLSLSPELFFTMADGRISARPMKGTAARHADPAIDRGLARALAADPKNRAENLMITDLLRNDLSRMARPGTVRVPALFSLETYAYVHQLTSTVVAEVAPGRDAIDALQALFPCGSVTGAPKIRAQEIIAEVEPEPRGLYCGAIGSIGPGAGRAHFNVAIRTLVIDGQSPGRATLGLGSGIVADSAHEGEWAECLAKAHFLAVTRPQTLIETMRRDAGGGIAHLPLHLARLEASAAHLGFAMHRPALLQALAGLPPPPVAERLRLLMGRDGRFVLQRGPAPLPPEGPVTARLVPLPVAADDWRLSHKTGDRAFYDEARRTAGTFEAIFLRPDGTVTEGSITNVFVADGAGHFRTPPTPGLLPGILRQHLLDTGRATEAALTRTDVETAAAEGRLFLGNALRGLIPARLA